MNSQNEKPFYSEWIFPSTDHIIGRSQERENYISYLEHHHILPLLGSPGCGLKSMAAYIGQYYRKQGYDCFWFTFRDAYCDKVDDFLWEGSKFLSSCESTAYQQFLAGSSDRKESYSVSFKFSSFLDEIYSKKLLLVLSNTQVVNQDPIFEAFFIELSERLRYTSDVSIRVILAGNTLPLIVEDHALSDLTGLSIKETSAFLLRMGVEFDENVIQGIYNYTLGYPIFLQLYGWITKQCQKLGQKNSLPEDIVEDLWLQRYIHMRYRLDKLDDKKLYLLFSLSVLNDSINHKVLRQSILPEPLPGAGYLLAQLAAERLVLTDAVGRSLYLHPIVRDIIREYFQESQPERYEQIKERVDEYYKQKDN